jgi:hypothetical protein
VLPNGDRGTCPPDHQTFVLEQLQRLLHRGVGRVEAGLQVGRGREAASRGDFSAHDFVAQVGGNAFMQRAAVGAFGLGLGHGHSILISYRSRCRRPGITMQSIWIG